MTLKHRVLIFAQHHMIIRHQLYYSIQNISHEED